MLTTVMAIITLIAEFLSKWKVIWPVAVKTTKFLAHHAKIRRRTKYEEIESAYKRFGGKFDPKGINIFGVRVGSGENSLFDDIVGIAHDRKLHLFRATTDPGKFWTHNTKRKGVAHLCDGFHVAGWMVGTHRKGKKGEQRKCLIQTGAEVGIWRDVNKNHQFDDDEDILETGYFGINFHHGYGKDTIGRTSAGCQVIQNPQAFKKFMRIIMNSNKYQTNKKHAFNYMLFDSNPEQGFKVDLSEEEFIG